MIINIKLSVEELSALPNEEASQFFAEVVRSSRRGYHRVIIPRSVARFAEMELDLSAADKAHLVALGHRFAELSSLLERSSCVVEVVRGDAVLTDGDAGIFSVGHRSLVSGNYLEPCLLILENATNDGELFKIILSHEAKRQGFGELRYELCNGGGSGTAAELTRVANHEQRIIACICDTDAIVPKGARSSTYNSVMTAAKSAKIIGVVTGTPGREAENFIPVSIIRLIAHPDRYATLEYFSKILEEQRDVESGDCLWLYFDIKEGFSKGRIAAACTNPDDKNWFLEKYKVKESEIDSFELSGFGPAVMEVFLNNDLALSEFFDFSRSKYWEKHFSVWSARVLWAVAGAKAVRCV